MDRLSHELDATITQLENRVEGYFRAGRYRDFFDEAHAVRVRLQRARLAPSERERLWQRLHRCTDAAKARQAREFAERDEANLSRWREQVLTAGRYAAALRAEIDELTARGGSALDRARWQRRVEEKRARLVAVQANVAELRAKIESVSARCPRA
jgi:chromosome segregation ATPase